MGDETLRQQWRSLCNIDCALVVAGMVMLWPILRAPFQLTVMSEIAFGIDPHFLYDLSFLAIGVMLVLATTAFDKLLSSERTKAWCSALAGLLCFAGVTLLLGFSDRGGSADALVFAGAFVLSCGIALLFTLWSLRLIRLSFGLLCCCVTLSFAASFLLGAFDYSRAALRVLCYVLPLGSAGLLSYSFFRICRCLGNPADAEGASAYDQGEDDDEFLRGHVGNRMVFFFLVVGLIASAVVRSLWMHSSSAYQMSPNLVPTYVISIALAVAYVVIAFLSKEKGLGMLLGVTLTMAVLFVGILLCAIVGTRAGLGAVASSHTSFEFLLFVYLALAAFGVVRPALHGVGFWLIAEGATSILALLAIPRVMGISSDTSADLTMVIALSSMTLIAVSFIGLAILLLRDSMRQRVPALTVVGDPSFVDAALTFPEVSGEASSVAPACPSELDEEAAFDQGLADELLRAYGLTEREAQVAACVARGNSVKRVAELLFLAPSTVQGYMKSIYRKMGINRKQSLVDIAHSLSARK